jgi:hypothetical protein
MGGMDFLYASLVLLHFLSWAIVLGFAVAFLRKGEVPRGLMHAALSALVTGILIVGAREMTGEEVDYIKIGIKLVIAAVVAGLAVVAERRAGGARLLGPIAGLTAVNMAVAVFL